MVDFQQYILSIIAAGGGGGALAYVLFKSLGEKWLDNKFASRLQEHKHEQEKEIQRLRAEIDSMLNGVLKLQEREFQVLPELWEKIHEAYRYTLSFVASFQNYPSIEKMNIQELEEFFCVEEWMKESQKKSIRESADRNKEYQEIYFWHQYNLSYKAIKELQLYSNKNGIFFPKTIFSETEQLVKTLISLLTRHEQEHRRNTVSFDTETTTDKNTAETLYNSLKSTITQQLRSHTKQKATE